MKAWLNSLQQWFDALSDSKACIGIEILADGLAVAGCKGPAGTIDCVDVLSTHDAKMTPELMEELLKPYIEKNHLDGASCYWVLPSGYYQLLLVEAPDVPEEELCEAIRWRIKDLIHTSVEAAAIDIFLLPADASRGGKKMVYVVASELEKIASIVAVSRELGLNIKAIDIAELALRNLTLHQDSSRSIALARLQQGTGSVSVYRDGNLYLSRQFSINYNAGLLDDLPSESLALEVQRSLDYFERQMGQAPPSALYLCGDSVSADKIGQDLSRGLTIPVKYFDLAAELHLDLPGDPDALSDSAIDEGILQLCVAAIGGLKRAEVS